MKIYEENSLRNCNFWGGAVENAYQLTPDELDELEAIFENDLYPDGINRTELNDLFWFEFPWLCSLLGLDYDSSQGEIIRD